MVSYLGYHARPVNAILCRPEACINFHMRWMNLFQRTAIEGLWNNGSSPLRITLFCTSSSSSQWKYGVPNIWKCIVCTWPSFLDYFLDHICRVLSLTVFLYCLCCWFRNGQLCDHVYWLSFFGSESLLLYLVCHLETVSSLVCRKVVAL